MTNLQNLHQLGFVFGIWLIVISIGLYVAIAKSLKTFNETSYYSKAYSTDVRFVVVIHERIKESVYSRRVKIALTISFVLGIVLVLLCW